MNTLKKLWDWLCGAVKSLLETVLEAAIARAKERAKDTDLMGAALEAVKAAARQGLTGDKAWVAARDQFTAKLRELGRDLTDTAIDTALQTTYDAWKSLGKPDAQ